MNLTVAWNKLPAHIRAVAAWVAGVAAAVGAVCATIDASGIVPGLHLPAQAVAVLVAAPAVLAGAAAFLRGKQKLNAAAVTHVVVDVEKLAEQLAPFLRNIFVHQAKPAPTPVNPTPTPAPAPNPAPPAPAPAKPPTK